MARHLPGFALFRFVIRLPIKFPRSIKSTLSDACDFWLRISQEGSYQAIRTFPRGYASYSQTEVNTLLSRQKSSYSIRSGPRVIHNEHCFQSATDFLIYTQIAILFSMHTGRTHEDYFTVFGANSARIASKIRVSSALSAGRIRLSNSACSNDNMCRFRWNQFATRIPP